MTLNRFAVLMLALSLGGCAAYGERPVERTMSTVVPKDIGVVRAAAMSSLMRMGLQIKAFDSVGEMHKLDAYGDKAEIRVALQALEPTATRMQVAVLASPEDELMRRFVDGVEGVLGTVVP